MAELCVELDAVEVSYPNLKALKGISLHLKPSDQMLLLGRNGSGKSTLLRVCAGLLRPSKGNLSFWGKSPVPFSELGYVGHAPMLYGQLSVQENLDFFASLCDSQQSVTVLMQDWDLTSVKERRVSELSKGLTARVSLCRAFLSSPKILYLDEPSSTLDDQATSLLLEVLKKERDRNKDFVCIVATHDVARFSSFGNRAVLLDEGNLIEDSREISKVIDGYRRGNR